MNKTIGIIGLGSISKRHVKNIKNLYPTHDISCLSSRNNSSSNYEDIFLDCYFCNNLKDLISRNPLFVIISCPSNEHLKFSKELIQKGIPILIEKPISSNYEDAKLIYDLAIKNNVKTQVGYCLRYLSSTKYILNHLKDHIKDSLLSVYVNCSSYLPDWRDKNWKNSVSANKSLGGGVLLELSHEIDLLLLLFDNIYLNWSHIGASNSLALDVEESASAVFLTQNKNPIYVDLNFCQKVSKRIMEFNTIDFVIKWDILRNTITKYSQNNQEILFKGESSDHDLKYIDMVKEFYDGNVDYTSNLKDAVNVLKIIDQIKN